MRVLTVHRLRKNFGDGCLSCSARSGEEIAVTDSPVDNLIFQRAHDRITPADILKGLGAVFSIQRKEFLFCHKYKKAR